MIELGYVALGLESARCRGYVDEFKHRLRRFRTSTAAREFAQEARSSKLWVATGQ